MRVLAWLIELEKPVRVRNRVEEFLYVSKRIRQLDSLSSFFNVSPRYPITFSLIWLYNNTVRYFKNIGNTKLRNFDTKTFYLLKSTYFSGIGYSSINIVFDMFGNRSIYFRRIKSCLQSNFNYVLLNFLPYSYINGYDLKVFMLVW